MVATLALLPRDRGVAFGENGLFVYVAQYNFCDINQEFVKEGFCELLITVSFICGLFFA